MNGSVLNKRALKIEYALPFVFGIILLFVFAISHISFATETL